MRLFRTITLMLILLTTLPVAVTGFILIHTNRSTYRTLVQDLQRERLLRLVNLLDQGSDASSPLDMRTLVEKLAGESSEVLLVDQDLKILQAPHFSNSLVAELEPQLKQPLQPLDRDTPGANLKFAFLPEPLQLLDGRSFTAVICSDASRPWRLVDMERLDPANRSIRSMMWQVVLLALVSLSLAGGLGTLFAFKLTRPISEFVKGALAVARGSFGITLDIKARNEIGELAHTFNYMSRQLSYYDNKNIELVVNLEKGYLDTIRALANSIDAKDPYTRGHSDRVTRLAVAVAKKLELGPEEVRILRYGGILHDIGKIGINEQILGKRERLTKGEREIIHQHPVLGEIIIEPVDFLQPIRSIVRHHHERMDGTGYPDGLKGKDIPLGARIINATDTYDAVTSERPYQTAVDDAEAIEILKRLRGTQIDPRVCDALIAVIEEKITTKEIPPLDDNPKDPFSHNLHQ